MPIYEYKSLDRNAGCRICVDGFERLQGIEEEPLSTCPNCGGEVRKIISWCRAAIVEPSHEHTAVTKKIADYEREGMWSHAAELADTHSEKTGDKEIKMRALDNYEKAGYDPSTLEKHAKASTD